MLTLGKLAEAKLIPPETESNREVRSVTARGNQQDSALPAQMGAASEHLGPNTSEDLAAQAASIVGKDSSDSTASEGTIPGTPSTLSDDHQVVTNDGKAQTLAVDFRPTNPQAPTNNGKSLTSARIADAKRGSQQASAPANQMGAAFEHLGPNTPEDSAAPVASMVGKGRSGGTVSEGTITGAPSTLSESPAVDKTDNSRESYAPPVIIDIFNLRRIVYGLQYADPSFDTAQIAALCRERAESMMKGEITTYFNLSGHLVDIKGLVTVDPIIYEIILRDRSFADSLGRREGYEPNWRNTSPCFYASYDAGKAFAKDSIDLCCKMLFDQLRHDPVETTAPIAYRLAYLNALYGRFDHAVVFFRIALSFVHDDRTKVIWAFNIQAAIDIDRETPKPTKSDYRNKQ